MSPVKNPETFVQFKLESIVPQSANSCPACGGMALVPGLITVPHSRELNNKQILVPAESQ
jgi:hypothetical protein